MVGFMTTNRLLALLALCGWDKLAFQREIEDYFTEGEEFHTYALYDVHPDRAGYYAQRLESFELMYHRDHD